MLLPKKLGLNLSQKIAPIQTESLLPPSSILCCKARQLRAVVQRRAAGTRSPHSIA